MHRKRKKFNSRLMSSIRWQISWKINALSLREKSKRIGRHWRGVKKSLKGLSRRVETGSLVNLRRWVRSRSVRRRVRSRLRNRRMGVAVSSKMMRRWMKMMSKIRLKWMRKYVKRFSREATFTGSCLCQVTALSNKSERLTNLSCLKSTQIKTTTLKLMRPSRNCK